VFACDFLLGGLFCSSTNLPNDLHSLPLSFLIIQSCSISQVKKKKHTQRKGKADNNLVSVVVRLSNSLPLSLYSLSLSTFFLNRVAVIIYFVSLAFTSVCFFVCVCVWTNCFDGKKETRVGGDFTFPRLTSIYDE
jgi:succinate-acetate transporter protein